MSFRVLRLLKSVVFPCLSNQIMLLEKVTRKGEKIGLKGAIPLGYHLGTIKLSFRYQGKYHFGYHLGIIRVPLSFGYHLGTIWVPFGYHLGII